MALNRGTNVTAFDNRRVKGMNSKRTANMGITPIERPAKQPAWFMDNLMGRVDDVEVKTVVSKRKVEWVETTPKHMLPAPKPPFEIEYLVFLKRWGIRK